jgi:hypothetical protein
MTKIVIILDREEPLIIAAYEGMNIAAAKKYFAKTQPDSFRNDPDIGSSLKNLNLAIDEGNIDVIEIELESPLKKLKQ